MTLEIYTILLSETEANAEGAEGVYATIRNDHALNKDGTPIFGKEYGYEMFGVKLHGPIPTEARKGFSSSTAAENAAKQEYKEWRAGNIPNGIRMPRHVAWRTWYRGNRYLEYVDDKALVERHHEILNNLFTLTEERKIGIIPMEQGGDYFAALQTHVYEECLLRKYKYPHPLNLDEIQYPDYDWVGLEKAANHAKTRPLNAGEFLVKYGEYKYLHPTYEKGKIRISPATAYQDPSLNLAINDDELNINIYFHPNREELRELEILATELDNPYQTVGNIEWPVKARTNYYAYCLGADFSLRMFPDFQADSCLLIYDPKTFIERIFQAMSGLISNWKAFGSGIKYIDPYNTIPKEIAIYRTKHFKYAYQKEYRLCWMPPSVQSRLY